MGKLQQAARSFGGVRLSRFRLGLVRYYFGIAKPGSMYFDVVLSGGSEPHRVYCHYTLAFGSLGAFVVTGSHMVTDVYIRSAKLNLALTRETAGTSAKEAAL